MSLETATIRQSWTPQWTPPYALRLDAAGHWLLVETETGEVVDDFGGDERLARETLHDQLAA